MNGTYSVYKHTSPSGKVYIGITSMNPKARWKAGYKDCHAFYNAIQKYGWESIKSEVLFTGLTKDDACAKEIELIAQFNSTNPKYGYNISRGGVATMLGVSVSDSTRQKLSKAVASTWENETYRLAHSGENAYWYGKHHSEESLQKIRDHHPDQSGVNHPMYGKHHTEESRRKMSEAKVGKYLGADSFHAKPVIQMDANWNIIAEYKCIVDACIATGAHGSNIAKVINGKRQLAAGYRWKLKEAA